MIRAHAHRDILVFLAASAISISLAAHEGIHEQIGDVTRALRDHPQDAALYLKRGELYRLHESWDAAHADYDRASKLDPDLIAVDLARGTMQLDRGQPGKALGHLDRYLAKRPDDVEALLTRARARASSGDRGGAVRDYTHAIDMSPQPRPDWYIERATVESGAGLISTPMVLKGIDEGIAKLGPLVTLQLFAIDVEMKAQRYDDALLRLDTITAQSPRKESWLVRRAEILEAAGREDEAGVVWKAALDEIESLPQPLRLARTTQELEAKVREKVMAR